MLIGEDLEFPYDYGTLFIEDKANSLDLNDDWSKEDDASGCQFNKSSIQFLTLDQAEFGIAELRVFNSPYVPAPKYQRVIQVPLVLEGSVLSIFAVDRYNLDVNLEPGYYKIVIAQEFLGIDEETDGGKQLIDVFVTKELDGSVERKVIVSDEELNAGGRGLAT